MKIFDDFDDTTVAADWRAAMKLAHEIGEPVDRDFQLAMLVADLFEIPDDMPLLPAVCAAMTTPTRLDDPASVARTREIALAAGRGEAVPFSGIA